MSTARRMWVRNGTLVSRASTSGTRPAAPSASPPPWLLPVTAMRPSAPGSARAASTARAASVSRRVRYEVCGDSMPRVMTPGAAGPPARALTARVQQQVPVARGRPCQSLERFAAAAAVADVLDDDGEIGRRAGGPVVPGAHGGAVVPGEAHVPGVDQGQGVVRA